MYENRETSVVSESSDPDRTGQAQGRTPVMYAAEESDSGVLLMNQSNKVDQPSMAEAGEGRPEAKENSCPSCMPPTQSGKSCMFPGRKGVREAATLRRHYPR